MVVIRIHASYYEWTARKRDKMSQMTFPSAFSSCRSSKKWNKDREKEKGRNKFSRLSLWMWIHDHHYPSFNHLCSDRVHADTVQTQKVGFAGETWRKHCRCVQRNGGAPHTRTVARVKQANKLVKLAIKKKNEEEPKQRININTFAVQLSRSLPARWRRPQNSKNFLLLQCSVCFLANSELFSPGIFTQMLITFSFCRRVFPFICLMVRGSWMLYKT